MFDIQLIATQFENKTLPKEKWTHQAHIAVAFVKIVQHQDFNQALTNLREGIKAYNISVGTQNTETSGYHETLTVFWLTAVSEFYAKENYTSIDTAYSIFIKTLPALPKFPLLFYTRDLLFSKIARQNWVQPDLLPFSEITNLVNKNLEQHFILTDEEFEEQFANSLLDVTLFSHEAHLRLAWINITKYGESQAIKNITEQLQKYVQYLGATDKYNETLTIAAIKVVKHFIQKKESKTFYDFITNHPNLKQNFKDIISQHYSFDIFNSIKAKETYLKPDLLEFS